MVFESVAESVRQFVGYAQIVAVILIIYYLIRLLFCGESDSGGGSGFRWPKWPGGGDKDEPGGPDEPDEPDEPDNPDEPDEPDEPEPGEPDKPDKPKEPKKPSKPDDPDDPGPDPPPVPPPKKANLYGGIFNIKTGNYIKSKITLTDFSEKIKEETSLGNYHFFGLDPKKYEVISEPKGKFIPLKKIIILPPGENIRLDFKHEPIVDDDEDKRKRKRADRFLFEIAGDIQKYVINEIKENKSKDYKFAKDSWKAQKGYMTKALRVAREEFALTEIDEHKERAEEILKLIRKLRAEMNDKGYNIPEGKKAIFRSKREKAILLSNFKRFCKKLNVTGELAHKLMKEVRRG